MAGSGRKTFSPGDVLTSSDVQNYLMDQSVMVFSGTATRNTAIPSPSAGMVAYSTATSLQVYNGTAWVSLSTGYGVATGGTSITPWTVSTKNYNGMKFTTDGTLTVTKAGLFDVLVQSGGNGGGGGANYVGNSVGGGGSAGMQVRSTLYLAATTHTVKVGAGGAGVRNPSVAATSAQLSSIGSSIGLYGGGSGNGYGTSTGGATISTSFTALAGGTGTSGAANGGGGGAGVVGAGNNSSGSTGGAGGTGFDATDYNGNVSLGIGGGGGGSSSAGIAGAGTSGGGNGSVNAAGSNATANTGAGGGGGSTTAPFTQRLGGNGGSGIVFVRFEV